MELPVLPGGVDHGTFFVLDPGIRIVRRYSLKGLSHEMDLAFDIMYD